MSVFPDETETEGSSQLATSYGKTEILKLNYNVAGLLCYLPFCMANVICSVVVMATEPRQNYFLRFHAAQSLVLAVGMFAAGIVVGFLTVVLGIIPVLGWLLTFLVHCAFGLLTLGYIGVSIMGMIAAYQRRSFRLPKVAEIADRYVNLGQ